MQSEAADARRETKLREVVNFNPSRAYLSQALDRMVGVGSLSRAEADGIVEKMRQSCKLRVASKRREEVEQIKAVRLQRKLEVERSRADKGPIGGSVYILQLKEERDDADSENVLLQETLSTLEMDEKQATTERNVLRGRLDKIIEEAREALQPHIEQLKGDIADLEKSLGEQNARCETARGDVRRAKGLHNDAQAELARIEEMRTREQVQYNKAAGQPETIKRQIEMVQSQVAQVHAVQQKLAVRTKELQSQAAKFDYRIKTLQEREREMELARSKNMVNIERKAKAIASCQEDIAQRVLNNEQLLEHQARLDMEAQHAEKGLRVVQEEMQKQFRAKEAALRKLSKAEAEVKEIQDSIPGFVTIREGIRLEIVKQTAERAKSEETAEVLRKEVAAIKEEVAKSEVASREILEVLLESNKDVAKMEETIAALKREQDGRDRQIRELASRRDNAGRQVSVRLLKYKEATELVQLKSMEIKDLKKQRKEVFGRVKEFEQLFELVKNQRNKFMNLIQASSQSIAEMREKLKILDNEIDILRAESADMDNQLQKQRHDYQISQAARDQLQNDKNRKLQLYQARQDLVDQQIAEMDKLNSVVNREERDMLRLKKAYEMAIEARNYTGIVLIDRNDELCILYEKANIQDDILKRGELLLKAREDDVRVLKIEIADLDRSIQAIRKAVPEIPELDTEIASLKAQLLEAQREAEQLSLALEDPDNNSRWKRLDGPIPDQEELDAKITQLTERLNDKKEQLLERQLVLEEVQRLSDRLRAQAVDGRARSLDLAQDINEHQNKIRTVSRKMMAAVSELSMYQASVLKLEADQKQLETLLVDAEQRLAQGLAPTEEAEREWFRMERQAEIMAKMRREKEEFERLQDAEALGLKTTAEPRPNAYVPDGDLTGAPKPYAHSQPFKPTQAGAAMRHIRKPQPREIVL